MRISPIEKKHYDVVPKSEQHEADQNRAITPAARIVLFFALYSKAHSLKHLDDEAFQIMINYSAMRTTPAEQIAFQHVHWAASRIGPTETAFALREEHYAFQITTG